MVVRMSTEMETNIVSVERIAQYTRVESEVSLLIMTCSCL